MKHNQIYSWLLVLLIPFCVYKFSQNPIDLYTAIFTFVFIYLMTDFISGILHVILDNERSLDVKILHSLAWGFHSHHQRPKEIYEMKLYNHLYVMHLPLTLIFFIILLINQPVVYFAYLSLAVSLHLMQMSHRWAHTPKNMLPKFVIFLQNIGLVLSAKTHAKHHNNVYDRNFCMMNGWSNFMVNFLVKVFGRTSHGWNIVFLAVLICMLTLPMLF